MVTIKPRARFVNVLHSKNVRRMVVVCPTCPLNGLALEAVNQKTSCLYIMVKSKKAHRINHRIKKEQECTWYKKDSIKRNPNGIASVDCLHQ